MRAFFIFCFEIRGVVVDDIKVEDHNKAVEDDGGDDG